MCGFVVLLALGWLLSRTLLRPVAFFPGDADAAAAGSLDSFSVNSIPILAHFFGTNLKDCHTIVQPKKPEMLFGRWQVQQQSGFPMVSVWGAFLDTRPQAGAPTIRIFAVSEEHDARSVTCQIWFRVNQTDKPLLALVEADFRSIGRGMKRGSVRYLEYLYNCPVPTGRLAPQSVSLTFTKCANSSLNVPVTVIEKRRTPLHVFGVCVAAAYNRIDPSRVIEWVELLKILGVSEINIYNSNLVSDTLSVLKHYKEEGVVQIYDAPPPLPTWDYWSRKLAVVPGFNDCMYRNMYKYNYTVVIDFDEVIIPQKHLNYTDMLKHINAFHKSQSPSRPAMEFRNAYYFSDSGPVDDNVPKALYTLRFRRRAPVSKSGYSVKSITDPRTCVVMLNHYCLVKLPGLVGKFVMYVDPRFALNQHYKTCHLGKECAKMLNESQKDDVMLRFRTTLEANVKSQFKKLNMTFG